MMFSVTPRSHRADEYDRGCEVFLVGLSDFGKIHLKDERVFSQDEETKLQSSLSLKREELQSVLDELEYILREISYEIAKPDRVLKQLELVRLDRTKSNAVVDAWTSRAKTVIANLRQTHVEPKQLDSVNWRLNLAMGQSTRTKLKQPIAHMDLGINDERTKRTDHVFLEFNQQELFALYSQVFGRNTNPFG
uniref:COMM domain-containing protein n=1 Tax=Strigamia maritima TaxID=126957 RepID=T1JK68_STRMM